VISKVFSPFLLLPSGGLSRRIALSTHHPSGVVVTACPFDIILDDSGSSITKCAFSISTS
jgi:hypothetical protein